MVFPSCELAPLFQTRFRGGRFAEIRLIPRNILQLRSNSRLPANAVRTGSRVSHLPIARAVPIRTSPEIADFRAIAGPVRDISFRMVCDVSGHEERCEPVTPRRRRRPQGHWLGGAHPRRRARPLCVVALPETRCLVSAPCSISRPFTTGRGRAGVAHVATTQTRLPPLYGSRVAPRRTVTSASTSARRRLRNRGTAGMGVDDFQNPCQGRLTSPSILTCGSRPPSRTRLQDTMPRRGDGCQSAEPS